MLCQWLLLVQLSILVTGAPGKKKCPLVPVSVIAVAEGGRLEVELGGLQVLAVALTLSVC